MLLALGSEEQIKNLETERGFKQENVVRARQKISPTKPKKPTEEVVKKKPTKIDVGIQSDVEMENTNKNIPQIEQFLSQLIAEKQQQKICVENATNTENQLPSDSNVKIKKTADLLDTLQEALAVKESSGGSGEEMLCFKAHVVVENALHLPFRKKCKSRKSKSKLVKKQEDCLPSTYVTFETMVGAGLKVTPIAHRTTNPKWDYRCDVSLPRELLSNVSGFFCEFLYIF